MVPERANALTVGVRIHPFQDPDYFVIPLNSPIPGELSSALAQLTGEARRPD